MSESVNVVPVYIEEELRSSFLDYSMSVIISRALPDIRDGLKPVHRRILYAMYNLKNFHNKPYLKSARVVGEVIGRYHPHGDTAVYDALVRMAQDFSMRYPLVDGQGNFGSIDGDVPAAMRYTEVRLEEISSMLIEDIEKETIDFIPNYDNKELEPVVLPSKIPQLLINGSSGIAVGMATNIPPHNITEVIDGLLFLIDNPNASIQDIINIIKGPDFPTGGMIIGTEGIIQAYHTGKGSIVIRGKTQIEEPKTSSGKTKIIINQIPYQVNKAKLIERIAELIRDKVIDGINDIRDESAQDDIRIILELKKGEYSEIILNNLYKHTPLQISYGINIVALHKGVPKLLNLKEVLNAFYQHRYEVVLRRTAFDLKKAEEKAHILEGLKIAVENLDEVIPIIRKSINSAEAHDKLVNKFNLSDVQVKAILEMRLSRLTSLEREKIIEEYSQICEQIKDLKNILDTPARVVNIIKEELIFVKEKYGDSRHTDIIHDENESFSMEHLIPDEDVVIVVTYAGYIKRTPLKNIRSQKRGGKGRKGIETKSEDIVKEVFITSNHQYLWCFTNLGRVYAIKVYDVPETNLPGRGKHFANLIKLMKDEQVVSVVPIRKIEEGKYIISVTANGFIKKTELVAFANLRTSGIVALKLDEGDNLVACAVTSGKDNILIATKLGKAIHFKEEEIRPMGRSTRGVTGIRFSEENDKVIGLTVITSNASILSVCENGFGKRTPLEEYRLQSRGGKGIYTVKITEKNGPVVGILQVSDDDDIVIMTSSNKVMRFKVQEIGLIGRFTQGVKLMNLEGNEKVTSFAKITKIDGEEVIDDT